MDRSRPVLVEWASFVTLHVESDRSVIVLQSPNPCLGMLCHLLSIPRKTTGSLFPVGIPPSYRCHVASCIPSPDVLLDGSDAYRCLCTKENLQAWMIPDQQAETFRSLQGTQNQ